MENQIGKKMECDMGTGIYVVVCRDWVRVSIVRNRVFWVHIEVPLWKLQIIPTFWTVPQSLEEHVNYHLLILIDSNSGYKPNLTLFSNN